MLTPSSGSYATPLTDPGDGQQVVDGQADVVDVEEVCADLGVRFGRARADEVAGHQFGAGEGDAVLRQQFTVVALHALGRGAVVAKYVEDQGVVTFAQAFQLVKHLAGLDIGVFHEAGIHLHQPGAGSAADLRWGYPKPAAPLGAGSAGCSGE